MSIGLLIGIIIIGVILLLIALVLFIRVRFFLEYQDDLTMRLYVGPFRLKHVFDSKEEKARRKGKEPEPEEPEEKVGGVKKIMKTVNLILKILRHLKGRVTIENLRLYCTIGSENPMEAALLYGSGWAAIGNIVGILENQFVIKKRDCQMFCQYCDMDMAFYIKLDMHMRVWDLLRAGKPDFIGNDKDNNETAPQTAAT